MGDLANAQRQRLEREIGSLFRILHEVESEGADEVLAEGIGEEDPAEEIRRISVSYRQGHGSQEETDSFGDLTGSGIELAMVAGAIERSLRPRPRRTGRRVSAATAAAMAIAGMAMGALAVALMSSS